MVRATVDRLNARYPGRHELHVVGISVAALMHVKWLSRKLELTGRYDRIVLPGFCQGDLEQLSEQFGMSFERGPKDVRDLEQYLYGRGTSPPDLSAFDIEIIAEINHAPALPKVEILRLAERYRQHGADVIDIGTFPGSSWPEVGEIVRELVANGFRVSIDSFDQQEVEAAVAAGAELVLSCKSSNFEWASHLGVELVVIPDDPRDLSTMWETADRLDAAGVPYRLDPILEPIGMGFTDSLARYHDVARARSVVKMMMGIGNVTELTDVDSAGVNVLLAAICQDLKVTSVLTTEVINWARTSVAEFDRARRLVKYAIENHVVPKRVSEDLVMLRDPRVHHYDREELESLARGLTDPNYRIFVEGSTIHVMNRDGHWTGSDPYELFDEFSRQGPPLDASHAFYLGYELAKAVTAMTLGKDYRQDQALHWGFLTIPEKSAHERRRQQNREGDSA